MYGKNGVFIADISKALVNSRDFFSIRNVTVSYLTSGDSYDFSTKVVTPDKSKA